MALRHFVYNTLVVSDSDSFNQAIQGFLPEGVFNPKVIATSVNEARRFFLEQSFDLVIVNGPLRVDTGMDFTLDCAASNTCAVLYLTGDSLFSKIRDRFMSRGIMTLLRPASPKNINQAIDDLCTMRERLRLLEKKVVSVEEKMAEIRMVNRAKWLLIEKKGMTEDEAHHYIEKQSMENSLAKTEFAGLLISSLTR